MKAVCPNNPDHKHFITVLQVTEDAVVDKEGNILCRAGTGKSAVVHGPNAGNTWMCKECGAEAEVTE